MSKKRNRFGKAILYVFVAVILTVPGLIEARAGEHYDSHGRRDPFVPLVGVERSGAKGGVKGITSIDDVVLQGVIMGSDGQKRAIVNGEILSEGDKIDRLSVQSIDNNTVKVKIEEDEYEIKLYK
jgi:hypothetical protein